MLSIFPSLLMLEGLAPFFLRLTLGIILILWAKSRFKQESMRDKQIGGIEFIIAVFLIVGYATQLAALAALLLLGIRLVYKIKEKAFFTNGVNYYFILFIIALSLLLTGPGFFAFDLPI
jgi:hypothetical protein